MMLFLIDGNKVKCLKFLVNGFMVILNLLWIIITVFIGDLLSVKIYYCCWKYVIQDGLYE